MSIPESFFWIRHGQSAGTDTVAAGLYTAIGEGWGATWGNGFATTTYSHGIDAVMIYNGSKGISANSDSRSSNAESGHTHTLSSHTHSVTPARYGVYA